MPNRNEVLIAGAGVSGLVLARMLSKRMNVKVIEKRNKVGFSKKKIDLVENSDDIDKFLEELRIKPAGVAYQSIWNSKSENFKLKLNRIDSFLFERPLLEMQLAGEAMDNGCELVNNARVVEVSDRGVVYHSDGKTVENKAEVIVGADGGDSKAAYFVDSKKYEVEYLYAYGVTGKFDNFNYGIPSLYFDKDLLDEGYVYVAPHKLTTVCAVTRKDARLNYNKFVRNLHLKGKVLNYFSGKGNVTGFRRSITRDNVLLVGEAAGLIDPCFGFGFKYAIISSYLAGKIILENEDLGHYEEQVKDNIYPSIRKGEFNKRILEKLDNNDLDLILKVLKKMQDNGVDFNHSNKEIIMNNKASLISVFLSNPRLFLLILKMMRSA